MFGNFGNKPPEELHKNPEEELAEFVRAPLSEKDILESLRQASSTFNQLPTLFQKQIGNEYLYRVQGLVFNNDVEHTVTFTLTDRRTKNPDAELEFEQDTENGVWNLRHRYIQTKNRGMNGSDFLKKAEEYFSILKNHQKVNLEKFIAFSSQPSVMLWLQKNGYQESGMHFDHLFDYENGNVIPGEGYFLIELKDPKVGVDKDPYLVKGDFLLDPEFEKLREGLSFDLADKRPYIEDNEVLNRLMQKGYIPRLSYEKSVI